MKRKTSKFLLVALLQVTVFSGVTMAAGPAAPGEVIRIWPGKAPGTDDWAGPETDALIPLPGVPGIHVISNITVPTLTVVRPAAGKANGTAMIVAPGGGFQNLAITHEGDMVARWLANRGITAFILRYRVRPNGKFVVPADIRSHPERFPELVHVLEPGRTIARADGLQAMRYLRANAGRYGIAPDRIGMIGFSAGAFLTMDVTLNGTVGERPNFAAPIYGAMDDRAPPEKGPPLFIAATQDDNAVPAIESVKIYTHWSEANLPAELHIYQSGGHGFGMIKHNKPVDDWTVAFEAWLRAGKWIGPDLTPPSAATAK